MTPDDAIQRVYNPNIFWDDPQQGIGGPLGSLDRRRLTDDKLQEFGVLLADLALPAGKVRALFENSLASLQAGEGLRLRLHIDAAPLAQLPWEFIALPQAAGKAMPGDFLALREEISIVRSDTVPAPPRKRLERPKARIVGVLSSPDGEQELKVENDKALIQEAVRKINEQVGKEVIETVWAARPATKAAIEKALAEPADIFHFAGHGVYDPFKGEGLILLEQGDYRREDYSSAQLASLLRSRDIRLAVLGACETGRRNGQNAWSGVAPALAMAQIPAILANQFAIDTTNAERLIETVYPLILGGFSVDEAVALARGVIYRANGLQQRDWGGLVCYLAPEDGVLFDTSQPEEAGGQVSRAFYSVAITVRDVIRSQLTGAKFDEMPAKDVDVKIRANDVKDGSVVTGVQIGKFPPQG
jgi:hypothetical protein